MKRFKNILAVNHQLPGDEETLARAVALLGMGTVSRTGIASLFIGNTTESVLRQVECSVLAVKPAGFDMPITS